MGLNFRKSFSLGKGFRTNVSKAGLGFSWGKKGFRISKSAKGAIRGTVSIPGTGISYSKKIGSVKGKLNTILLVVGVLILGFLLIYNNTDIIQNALANFSTKDNSANETINPVLSDNNTSKPSNTNASDTFVFVSSSGKKYHLETCRTLKDNKTKISLVKAIDDDYQACQICKPPVE